MKSGVSGLYRSGISGKVRILRILYRTEPETEYKGWVESSSSNQVMSCVPEMIPSRFTENLHSNTHKQVDRAICTKIEQELKSRGTKEETQNLFSKVRIHHRESYVSVE